MLSNHQQDNKARRKLFLQQDGDIDMDQDDLKKSKNRKSWLFSNVLLYMIKISAEHYLHSHN